MPVLVARSSEMLLREFGAEIAAHAQRLQGTAHHGILAAAAGPHVLHGDPGDGRQVEEPGVGVARHHHPRRVDLEVAVGVDQRHRLALGDRCTRRGSAARGADSTRAMRGWASRRASYTSSGASRMLWPCRSRDQAVDLGAVDARQARQLHVLDRESVGRGDVVVEVHRRHDQDSDDEYADHAARARAGSHLSFPDFELTIPNDDHLRFEFDAVPLLHFGFARWSISASTSAAVARPSTLMMKFACRSENMAPPRRVPLSPHPSIISAAYFPGGLTKVLPKLRSQMGCVFLRPIERS